MTGLTSPITAGRLANIRNEQWIQVTIIKYKY